MGVGAGNAIAAGNNNVTIASPGARADAATIRIGTQGTQTAAYLAGVYNTGISGTTNTVIVNQDGRLGTAKVAAAREVKSLRHRVRTQRRALDRQSRPIAALEAAVPALRNLR